MKQYKFEYPFVCPWLWLVSNKAFHHYPGESRVDRERKGLGVVTLGYDICHRFVHVTDEIRIDSGDVVGEGPNES